MKAWSTILLIAGALLGLFAVVEAKLGRGLIFHNWLLLPPRSYVAGLLALPMLLLGAWMLGRRSGG